MILKYNGRAFARIETDMTTDEVVDQFDDESVDAVGDEDYDTPGRADVKSVIASTRKRVPDGVLSRVESLE